MYYALKPEYSLRGWEKLPFALCKRGVAMPYFMHEPEFEFLLKYDGKTDFDSKDVTEKDREEAKNAEKNGIVDAYKKPHPISKEQEHYIYPARFVKSAHWSITGKCNFKCKHCYMSAPDAKFGELPRDTIMDIIDQLQECGVRSVSLTGGEALVRKDFWEIVDRLIAYDIIVTQIYSNGKLITDDFLDKLEKRRLYNVEIILSYDGKGYHDWLRGIDGAEEYVDRAFKCCQKRGFFTAAEMCLHKDNKHTLRESVNYLASVGCNALKTNPISDSEYWLEGCYNKDIPSDELYNLYLDYIPYFYKDGAPININLGNFFAGKKGDTKFFGIDADKEPQEPEDVCMCTSARKNMCISPDAVVLPCFSFIGSKLQKDFPSILEVGLKQCLNDSPYMDLVQMSAAELLEKFEECTDCEYKKNCLGGCRAVGCECHDGDLFGKDEMTCEYYKGGWPEKIRKVCQDSIKKYNK